MAEKNIPNRTASNQPAAITPPATAARATTRRAPAANRAIRSARSVIASPAGTATGTGAPKTARAIALGRRTGVRVT
ncbi:hypothetical protein GCM10010486_10960 [Nonomuraea roseoviolacea subsp. carminata]